MKKVFPKSVLSSCLIALSLSAQTAEPNDNSTSTAQHLSSNESIIMETDEIVVRKHLQTDEQIVFARDALAKQLDVEPSLLGLPSVHRVTWRSSALGCPEADKQYTQALVRGVLILFTFDGTEYRFHASRNGEPFYCPLDRAEPESADASEI